MDFQAVSLPQIRWMVPDDIESVMLIEQDGVSSTWGASRFETELANSACRYIVVNSPDKTTPLPAFGGLWLGVDEAHVVTMAVKDPLRRQGFGSLVLRALFAVAMDLQLCSVTLECRVGNDPAQRLYRKFGFVEVGTRPRYYSNGEDALIMTTDETDSSSFQRSLLALDEQLRGKFPGTTFMPEGHALSAGWQGTVRRVKQKFIRVSRSVRSRTP